MTSALIVKVNRASVISDLFGFGVDSVRYIGDIAVTRLRPHPAARECVRRRRDRNRA